MLKIGEKIKDECIKIKSTPEKCSWRTLGYINDIEYIDRAISGTTDNRGQFQKMIEEEGLVEKYIYDYIEELRPENIIKNGIIII